jgi:general secretion pathway protein A
VGAHLAATLWRPVLLIDEAQEMEPEVLSELRLLASTNFDSRAILTVVLAGDSQLIELLGHLLAQAGNPRLMTPGLIGTLCEHSAGTYRMLCNMAADLLAEGLRREVTQLDE